MNDRQEPHAVLAIETKKPVVVNDAFTDERVNREHMKQWGVRSVLVVPLVTEDQALGVLFFNRHQAGVPFQESHIEFADQLAASLSLAVCNARLFESLQAQLAERKKAEQTLQEANERLQAQSEELLTQAQEVREHEQALRYSEHRYRTVADFTYDWEFWLRPDGQFEYISPSVQSRQPYQAFARPFPYFDKPQQPTRYWNWRVTPLLDDKGQVQFLVFNLEDVREQQKTFGELEPRAGLLQKLTLELSLAEDRERRRLAEILHDDLQQVLAAAKFHQGLLTSRIQGDEQTKELADQLTRMLKESIEKSRSLSHELSPAVLYQGDLGETFEWLARQVQTKHGLTVHTEVHGKIDTSSEPLKAFLFRAAQEILFNTVKHAHVDEARLRLQRRWGQLWLTIADRGRGFDPQTLSRTTGFGLFSIRERVELLGGRMRIHSVQDNGSVVVIALSMFEEAGVAQRMRDAGAEVYLPKTGPSEGLLAAIRGRG